MNNGIGWRWPMHVCVDRRISSSQTATNLTHRELLTPGKFMHLPPSRSWLPRHTHREVSRRSTAWLGPGAGESSSTLEWISYVRWWCDLISVIMIWDDAADRDAMGTTRHLLENSSACGSASTDLTRTSQWKIFYMASGLVTTKSLWSCLSMRGEVACEEKAIAMHSTAS